MRGWNSPVTEISVFRTEISVTRLENFPYEHSSPATSKKVSHKQIHHGN